MEIYSHQSSVGVSEAGSNNSKSKVSLKGVLSQRASVEEAQCKGTDILSGKNNSSLQQSSPQEDLMGQLHNWDYDMTSQDRSLPFSSREAQGKGPAVQERVSRLSSPGKPQGHLRGRCQMASRAPFKRRVWKALKNGLIKGLGTSCHSKESAPSQQQSPGCELQGP